MARENQLEESEMEIEKEKEKEVNGLEEVNLLFRSIVGDEE